jgi:hypothetical protein
MKNKMALTLTISEVALLREILHFIELGEVSGGPLEGIKHQQTTANIKTFKRIQNCADGAYAHFFAPTPKEGPQ